MDLKGLQAQLRSFADARDWQSRHTPKNLAMALVVDAARLMEVFQWTTLTESRGVARDPGNKKRVADDIADVLLCLLQMADHTGVDVEEAVAHKLLKNVHKYPARHPALMPSIPLTSIDTDAAPTATAARVHLLVDWENVQPKGDELRQLERQGTDVWIFHSPQQKVDPAGHKQAYGAERVTLIPRSGTGRNALDFQLAYYVGYISARQPHGTFVIVSNDQGYESMLAHARELGFAARRCEFRRMPLLVVAPNPGKPTLVSPPLPAPEAASKAAAKTAGQKQTPAKAAPAPAKATRKDMQPLLAQLDSLPFPQRPAQKNALLVLLQGWLDEPIARSPRTLHALAQLQARQLVVLQGEKVSYPPVAAAKRAVSKPTAAKATPIKKAPAKKAPTKQPTIKKPDSSEAIKQPAQAVRKTGAAKPVPPPTGAQVARAVLASLQKMTQNKPRRRSGLLKHIETHAAKAQAPASMAQLVLKLLEARKDVVMASDGNGVTYRKWQ